jgi:hypothetical protein
MSYYGDHYYGESYYGNQSIKKIEDKPEAA